MIIIEELLSRTAQSAVVDSPETDPLTEQDALQEGQLIDMRFDAVHSRLGVIFELRNALQLLQGNTGVLIAHGVRNLTWMAEPRMTYRTAWSSVGSLPHCENGIFLLDLPLSLAARFALVATEVAFYIGDVADIPGAHPDYTEDDATVKAGIAAWNSRFEVKSFPFIDATNRLAREFKT